MFSLHHTSDSNPNHLTSHAARMAIIIINPNVI
jgi:hypothetical protein